MKKFFLILLVCLVSQNMFGMWGINLNFFGAENELEQHEINDNDNKNKSRDLKKSIAPGSYVGQYARDARKQAEVLAENILPEINSSLKDVFQEVRKTCGTFINPSLYFDRKKALEKLEDKTYSLREQKEVCDVIELAFIERRKVLCETVIDGLSFFSDTDKEFSEELISEFKTSLKSGIWTLQDDASGFQDVSDDMNQEIKTILIEQCDNFRQNLEVMTDTFFIFNDSISQEDFVLRIEAFKQEVKAIKLGKEETLNGVINNLDRTFQDLTSGIDTALQDAINSINTNTIVEFNSTIRQADDRINKVLDRLQSWGKPLFHSLIILALVFNMKFITEKIEQYGPAFWDIVKNSKQTIEQEDGKLQPS